MNKIIKHPARDHGYSLTGPSYLPTSEEELALREVLQLHLGQYRAIKSNEIETLIQNGNLCDDWGEVLVTERFNPRLVVGCQFKGRVRIGNLENFILEIDGQKFPVGLYHSTFISCDLGDNVSIDRIGYLAHCILGQHVIIQNVGRMLTRRNARFGHGVLKQGENESLRRWIDVGNENGGRAVLAFDGMTPGDAWLWSRYRGEPELMSRFREMTDRSFDPRPGYLGTIGDRTLIRNTQAIVDTAIGTDAWIDGALRLENLTIRSETRAASRIGDGVLLSDGIVGFACRIESGARAERFVLGENVKLQQGARVTHSIVGDNSTIAGCEVSNNLIFCNHEQHHSSSFLIATTLLGQNNIAAGATIGSNHTSRVPDGEIMAGRGFWPGLCVSLKHNSRFASYTILAKGDYPGELNLKLPFCLIANSEDGRALNVMPGYWFQHNLYALKRNEWKFAIRDQRVRKEQPLVFEALAPDTVEEIFEALELIEAWVATAAQQAGKSSSDARALLNGGEADALEVLAEGIENSRRPVRILKASRAWKTYREMALHYAVTTLLATMEEQRLARVEELIETLGPVSRGAWVNVGGQLVEAGELAQIKARIEGGDFAHWADLHTAMNTLWEAYPQARARHALATLLDLGGGMTPDELPGPAWLESLQAAMQTQKQMGEGVRTARAKDFEQPFRRMLYDDQAELDAVLGNMEKDPLIQHIDDQTAVLAARIAMQMEQTNITAPPKA